MAGDIEWLHTADARLAKFETTFGRPRDLPKVAIAATELAALMEAAR